MRGVSLSFPRLELMAALLTCIHMVLCSTICTSTWPFFARSNHVAESEQELVDRITAVKSIVWSRLFTRGAHGRNAGSQPGMVSAFLWPQQ